MRISYARVHALVMSHVGTIELNMSETDYVISLDSADCASKVATELHAAGLSYGSDYRTHRSVITLARRAVME